MIQGKNFLKVSSLCIAGTIIFSLNTMKVNAEPDVTDQAVAGISKILDDYANIPETEEINLNTEYENLGIANVSNFLNIRKGPGEDQEKVGKLPKDAGCEILEIDENGWAKIKSGKVSGYVLSKYLYTGEEAQARVEEAADLVATVVGTATLRVRASDSLSAETLALLPEDEELEVIKVLPEWIKVKLDTDEGYISNEYAEISYVLKKATTIEEVQTGETGVRAEMISYAKQFLGNRYVWGGTSLNNGVDCSGYTQAIYKKFGYSIPRVSRSQASGGKTIKSSNARPGDLFFYGKGNYINHVAIYMGGGKVIHASNPRSGIKISNAYYRTPIKVVRYIND